MNRQKLILSVTGGVIGLAVLAAGFFAWSAYSEMNAAENGDEEEGTDSIEEMIGKAKKLMRNPVPPSKESVEAIKANAGTVVEWREQAYKLASRSDWKFDETTPAAFKAYLVEDAKRLAALPGAVDGAIMKADFQFGPFRDYIAGGSMPDAAKLGELQRQWYDIAGFIELLAENGAAEITSVSLKAEEVKAEDEAAKGKNAKNKNRKKPAKAANRKDGEAGKPPSTCGYVFSFNAKPAAFVKIVNRLSETNRFCTVESFTFARPKDAIAEALGGEAKAEAQQSTSGRRRRRGAQAEPEKKPEEESKKGGIVTDPQLDAPLAVVMKVAITDFRSLEDDGNEGRNEGKKED